MLRFYWSLGRDIADMSVKSGYGSKFYSTVSSDLKDIFPDVASFSPTNLKYMRYFYEMYPDAGNRQQPADGLNMAENRQQLADDLRTDIVFRIPWGHHMFLLSKCRGDQKKALFYVRKTIENNWSRVQRQPYIDSKGILHGAEYVDIDLKPPKIPGGLRGDPAKDLFNKLTHFAMTHKKGTV